MKESVLVDGFLENFEIDNTEIDTLVDEVTKDFIPTPLQAIEDYKKHIALEVKKNIVDEFHVLRDGYNFVCHYNSVLKDKLKISAEIKEMLRNIVQVNAALKEGKSYCDILNWSNADLLEIYALAKKLLADKEYYESSAIFKLLCLLQPNSHHFWLGAGEALEEDNRSTEALKTYFGGILANPYAFDLYLYISRVFFKLGQKEKAIAFVEDSIKVIEQAEQQVASMPELSRYLLSLKSQLQKLLPILSSKQ